MNKILNKQYYSLLEQEYMQITDPDKFQMASVLTKNSKTGITSNKRLLVIKKGYLYYYSKVPKTFRGDPKVLQSYSEFPKCSIQILNIKKVNGYEQNSSYFSIQFEAKHMMEQQDIRKTMTLQEFNFAPKNTKQTITWQFTCDNQFIKQRWVAALNSLRSHYGKQKINIQKFFENINNKKDDKNSIPVRSSTRVPWREQKMKGSNSNENLNRTSYVNTMLQNNRLSSQQKKTSRSNSNFSNKNQSDLEFKKKNFEDCIVENFIKQDMEKQPMKDDVKQKDQTPFINYKNMQRNFNSETPQTNNRRNQQNINIRINQQPKNRLQDSFTEVPRNDLTIERQKKEELLINSPKSSYSSPHNSQKTYKLSQIGAVTPHTPSQSQFTEIKPKNQDKITQPYKKTIDHQQKKNKIEQIKPKLVQSIEIRSPIKHVSQKKVNKQPSKIDFKSDDNHTFYDCFHFSVCKQYSFHKRIQAQKKLNTMIGNFYQRCQQQFIEFVNSKSDSQSSRYRQIAINSKLASLQIGYLNFTIGYACTQGILINNKKRIYYDQQSFKLLKKTMKAYNHLFKSICSTYKTDINQNKNIEIIKSLRIPQCVYIQYRGVCCLAYHGQDSDQMQQDIVNQSQLMILRETIQSWGLNSTCFEFKKCLKSSRNSRIAYIKNFKNIFIEAKTQKKHHNVTFSSPMTVQFIKNAKVQNASVCLQSLSKYLKSISNIKNSQIFTCPKKQIQQILQYMYFCKYIRKFYRAAQAEIDQVNFLNLILKGDVKIMNMFETAGYQDQIISKFQNKHLMGIFFDFLEYYTGIKCSYTRKNIKYINIQPLNIFSIKHIDIIKHIKIQARVHGYDLNQLQLYQSFSKIDKHLLNQDIQLANKALEIKESVFFQNPYQTQLYPWAANLYCIFNSAQLSFIQNDYISSINHCKHFIDFFNEQSSQSEYQQYQKNHIPHIVTPIYMLLLKCYSKFSPQKFNMTLEEVSSAVIFNYGEQSTVMVTLFSLVAGALANMGEIEKAKKIYEASLKIGQKIYNKESLLQLLLDGSRLFKNHNQPVLSEKLLNTSRQLLANNQQGTNNNLLTKLNIFELEYMLDKPKTINNQQNSILLINQLQKNIHLQVLQPHTLRQLYKLYYNHGCKYENIAIINNSINKLWNLCLDSNAQILAIQLAYQYTLIKNKDRFQGIHNEANAIRNQNTLSKEKSLMVISQKKQDNDCTIMQLIQQCLLEQNLQILGAVYSLIMNSKMWKHIKNNGM